MFKEKQATTQINISSKEMRHAHLCTFFSYLHNYECKLVVGGLPMELEQEKLNPMKVKQVPSNWG